MKKVLLFVFGFTILQSAIFGQVTVNKSVIEINSFNKPPYAYLKKYDYLDLIVYSKIKLYTTENQMNTGVLYNNVIGVNDFYSLNSPLGFVGTACLVNGVTNLLFQSPYKSLSLADQRSYKIANYTAIGVGITCIGAGLLLKNHHFNAILDKR